MTSKVECLAEQQPTGENPASPKTNVVLSLEGDSNVVPICLEGVVIYMQIQIWPSNSGPQASWIESIKFGIFTAFAQPCSWDRITWVPPDTSVLLNKGES